MPIDWSEIRRLNERCRKLRRELQQTEEQMLAMMVCTECHRRPSNARTHFGSTHYLCQHLYGQLGRRLHAGDPPPTPLPLTGLSPYAAWIAVDSPG